MFDVKQELPKAPLYREEFEHDNCGIGACVNIHGEKSRATVENALKIVENLEHRAGKDAEGKTGDGVGILTQIPHKFFARVTRALGMDIGGEREYGVGMFFFPQEELRRNQAKKMFEIIVEKEESVERLNQILHKYGSYIIGRMGIPHKERGVNIISIAIDAPQNEISSLSGKLGMLEGVTAKAVYSKV